MRTFFDRFLKTHLLWKDRALSRRDLFSILVPFGKKRCRACGEESGTAGAYCPTCAKRRLQTLPGDPI